MNNTEATTYHPQHFSAASGDNVRGTIHRLPASEGVTDITAIVRNVSFTSLDRIDAEVEVQGFLSDDSFPVSDYWTLSFRLDVAMPGTFAETAYYGLNRTFTGTDVIVDDADLSAPTAEVCQLIANMTQRPVQDR